MKTRKLELELQVKELFEEFYIKKIIENGVTSFKLKGHEFKDLITAEFIDSERGKFWSSKASAEVFYKFIFTETDLVLLFVMVMI